MKVNIVIGRFQPLHNGHVRLITSALDPSAYTVVLIGCSDQDGLSTKNPLTFDERSSIIGSCFFKEVMTGSLGIFKLQDQDSDNDWLDGVQKYIQAFGARDVTIFVNDKDHATTRSNDLLATRFNLHRTKITSDISATRVRDLLTKGVISKDIPEDTHTFLLKKYKEQYTVDEVTCRACNEGILLPKIEDRSFTYLEVYQLKAKAPYLSCSVCGASIINTSCKQIFKEKKEKAIEKLFYN